MAILSLNELDFLARLLRFDITGTIGTTDMSQPIDNPLRSYVLVLKT